MREERTSNTSEGGGSSGRRGWADADSDDDDFFSKGPSFAPNEGYEWREAGGRTEYEPAPTPEVSAWSRPIMVMKREPAAGEWATGVPHVYDEGGGSGVAEREYREEESRQQASDDWRQRAPPGHTWGLQAEGGGGGAGPTLLQIQAQQEGGNEAKEKMAQLTAMGFPLAPAADALLRTGGDVSAAVALLQRGRQRGGPPGGGGGGGGGRVVEDDAAAGGRAASRARRGEGRSRGGIEAKGRAAAPSPRTARSSGRQRRDAAAPPRRAAAFAAAHPWPPRAAAAPAPLGLSAHLARRAARAPPYGGVPASTKSVGPAGAAAARARPPVAARGPPAGGARTRRSPMAPPPPAAAAPPPRGRREGGGGGGGGGGGTMADKLSIRQELVIDRAADGGGDQAGERHDGAAEPGAAPQQVAALVAALGIRV